MVNVLAFYSNDPSFNPAEILNVQKSENKLKRVRIWPINKQKCNCPPNELKAAFFLTKKLFDFRIN